MILKRVNELEKLTALIPALAKQNSQKAWNEFVQITGNDLHRYICYFLHDADHASDILQEVYILFLRDKEILNKICFHQTQEIAAKKIYAWLYKTARNKSLDLIKKKKNGIAAQLYLSQKSPSRELNMPTQNFEKKETNELIKYELSLLNEKQQDLLTLKFFHEKSNLEIASEINCEVISVPKLIDRALAQLKKRLEKVGVIISMVMIGESLSNKAMCVDMPAYLLPEVFQLYKTAPVGGLLTNSITLKGILMKSLYTIVGATVISTFVFYINAPTQEQKKIEAPKKVALKKENSKSLKAEPTIPIESINTETNKETVVNDKAEIVAPTILTYQLEKPVITFKINSIPQLIEDYKKSPYFRLANSTATGADFDKIDFPKVYDLYNDILEIQLKASEFKMLFTLMNNAKAFEYQSNVNKKFVLKLEYGLDEDAEKALEEINIWLPERISESEKRYGKSTNKIIFDHEIFYKTKAEKVGKTIYIFDDAKATQTKVTTNDFLNNIEIKIIFDEKLASNIIFKNLLEIFNTDISKPIQIIYAFTPSGLSEKIKFQVKEDEKIYFKEIEMTETVKQFLKTQNANNHLITHIKPDTLYPLIKILGTNYVENYDQKQLILNLLCLQKFKKSFEGLLQESFNGEIVLTSDSNSSQLLLGLTKENKIKTILDILKQEFELPFEGF